MTDRPERAGASLFETFAAVLGATALLLAIANVIQSSANRTLQMQIVEGQAKLAKAQAMANIDNSLVQLMAKVAAEKDDGAIRALLGRNGVTFKAGPPPQPAPDAAKAGTAQ